MNWGGGKLGTKTELPSTPLLYRFQQNVTGGYTWHLISCSETLVQIQVEEQTERNERLILCKYLQ